MVITIIYIEELKDINSQQGTGNGEYSPKDKGTISILADIDKMLQATTDSSERQRLQKLRDDVIVKDQEDTPYKYGNDVVVTTIHNNAAIMLAFQQVNVFGPPGSSFAMLVAMHFKMGDIINWDYKWDPYWQVPYKTFNGVNMNTVSPDGSSPKNYTDWIYFNGQLMGADKVSNLNWGYVGTKMGYSGPLLFNPLTTGGGDKKYIQMGVDMANNDLAWC